jgi:hypothetical protein
MRLLFINFDPVKKPALFLLLDDDGKRLVLLKHSAMDHSEIPFIRRMLPTLTKLPYKDKMTWFKKLRSWNMAYRQFTKTKITILSEFTPKEL